MRTEDRASQIPAFILQDEWKELHEHLHKARGALDWWSGRVIRTPWCERDVTLQEVCDLIWKKHLKNGMGKASEIIKELRRINTEAEKDLAKTSRITQCWIKMNDLHYRCKKDGFGCVDRLEAEILGDIAPIEKPARNRQEAYDSSGKLIGYLMQKEGKTYLVDKQGNVI